MEMHGINVEVTNMEDSHFIFVTESVKFERVSMIDGHKILSLNLICQIKILTRFNKQFVST